MLSFAPAECLGWNSIALHDAMRSRDDLAYCPIVYGFAVYGEDTPALSFGPLPGLVSPYDAGGVIGGAAVGLSVFSQADDVALPYLAFLLEASTQRDLFAPHGGQPARIEAWEDEMADRRVSGYYSGVRSTLARAVVRPRFIGYQQFEQRAGDRLEAMLREGAPTPAIVAMIRAEAARIRDGHVDPPYDRLTAEEATDELRRPAHVR